MLLETPGPDLIRRHDPFVRAVLSYFEALGREAGALAQPVDGYLAGGLGVRCYAGSRATGDIDVFFRGGRVLVPPNTTILARADGREYGLVFDHQYTPDFGLLHPDCEGRAVLLTDAGVPLRLSVLHPADLAVTKVARFQDHDREDVAALAGTGTFDGAALLALGREALAYMVGNPTFALENLGDAAEIVDRVRQTSSAERRS